MAKKDRNKYLNGKEEKRKEAGEGRRGGKEERRTEEGERGKETEKLVVV